MKIALVHDHLTQIGGAEMVLKAFHEIWPQAPIYTLMYDQKNLGEFLQGADIRPSYLQKIPGSLAYYQLMLPFMPTATEKHDLMEYEVVLSSSSALAKGVITRSNARHICYCHTPTRYLWSDTQRYVDELRYPKFVKIFIPHLLSRLRIWDQLAAQRVDTFIANSKNVSDRIKKYYRRESHIIHPPVDMNNFFMTQSDGSYFLAGGRLVSYKRFDLAVLAFNRLGIQLKIFGQGPEYNNLRNRAKSNIEFVGHVNEKEKAELYSRCIAFIHPHIEDFGITALEAMACGRPVIAFKAGGALETVIEGVSGTFFHEQIWEALADAVTRFRPEKFDSLRIHAYAQQFGKERFKKEIKGFVDKEYKNLLRYENEI